MMFHPTKLEFAFCIVESEDSLRVWVACVKEREELRKAFIQQQRFSVFDLGLVQKEDRASLGGHGSKHSLVSACRQGPGSTRSTYTAASGGDNLNHRRDEDATSQDLRTRKRESGGRHLEGEIFKKKGGGETHSRPFY